MNKKTLITWGVRLGSIALVTAVAGSLAANPKLPPEQSLSDTATAESQNGTIVSQGIYNGEESEERYEHEGKHHKHDEAYTISDQSNSGEDSFYSPSVTHSMNSSRSYTRTTAS